MIIYENTLKEFIKQCDNNSISNKILDGVKFHGFNVSPSEINSWDKSLPFVAKALDQDDVNKSLNVAVEYKFDVTRNRIDFLIFGKDDNNKDNVVIIELKQWSSVKNANKPNYVYAYGGGGAKDYEHPSYQALRYKKILEGFNSYVQDQGINISSCSYLHNLDNVNNFIINDYIVFPFVEQSPIFLKDDATKLKEFVNKYVSKNNRELLYYIDNAKIRPSSDFANLMYKAIEGMPIFSLDDEQQNSVSTIVHETDLMIKNKRRTTIIIRGGAGTGKSIVAINALGLMLNPKDGSKAKNAVYSTTNFTPRALFSELLIDNDYRKSAIKELFKPLASFSRASEFDYDCILLDEAHRAYIWKFGTGVKRNVDMIDKLFYASRVNVFFIDEDQMVTKDDYLTVDRIKKYARKYNSLVLETDDLKLSSQFRCLGGENYITFINSFLGYETTLNKFTNHKNYDFKVFDNPTELWKAIKEKQKKYPLSRLLAGYTYNWISKNDDTTYDFILDGGNFKMKWNKFVDYSYINDPTQFDRIGSIHTIQGVDMEYAGIIIGKDMKYRDGKVVFDKTENAKTDAASGIRNASNLDAERMIRNTYKVLMTRAIYGTYVYCEDEELRLYLKTFLVM